MSGNPLGPRGRRSGLDRKSLGRPLEESGTQHRRVQREPLVGPGGAVPGQLGDAGQAVGDRPDRDVEPTGGLSYGSKHSVQLEFWSWSENRVQAPVENVLTRRSIPRSVSAPAGR